MKKINKYGIMYFISTIVTLIFLKLANDRGSYWINVAWCLGVLWGMQTVHFYDLIEIQKIWKKKDEERLNKGGAKPDTRNNSQKQP